MQWYAMTMDCVVSVCSIVFSLQGWRPTACKCRLRSRRIRSVTVILTRKYPYIGNWPVTSIGILTALTQPSPDALRVAIRETRKLTSKPFGVNITLLPSINPPDYEGYARAAVEEGVKIFETAGNNRMAFVILQIGSLILIMRLFF
jgi:hypothetical protein